MIGNQETIDFEKEILPIFRQHCFECHGDGNTEGDLSLETIAAIRQGGHSGSPILSSQLGDSELYLRITSLSDGYRMPKRGPSLNQGDIKRIGQWIHLVSMQEPADADPTTNSGPQEPTANQPDANRIFKRETDSDSFSFGGMKPEQLAVFGVAAIMIFSLLFWLIYRMTEKSSRISHNTHRSTAFLAMMVGVFNSILLVAFGYFYWRSGELVKENQSLRAELRVHNPGMPATINISTANLPLPPYPMHPPRLGGRYYRGNDERDESLFNGGFYRTATIDLHLVDSNGNQLKWGDESKDGLAIEIKVQRAPNSTRELFSQRVLDQISVRHFSETEPAANRKFKFNVVEHEELWSVNIPLPKARRGERNYGMVYLMYGVQPGEQQAPRPHFGVRYHLQFDGRTIASESELWMGSLYTLGNRVLIPDEKKILLDRWFDWRPIPVIEGEASTDPKLLGTDEHLGQ